MIGIIGSLLLAFCGFPEAFSAVKTLSCPLTWSFLAMWGAGEILTLIYALQINKKVSIIPLIVNYGLNICFISAMVLVKSGVFHV